MSKGKPITIGEALERTEGLLDVLGNGAIYAGSLRRKYESDDDKGLKINDVDIVVPRIVEPYEVEEFGEILIAGNHKIRLVLPRPEITYSDEDAIKGLQVDIVMCEPEGFGACLLYLTGPSAYNIEMRGFAKSKGFKLNEKGLWDGDEQIAGETEKTIYKGLGLPWTRAGARDELKTFKGVIKWKMAVPSSRKGSAPYEVTLKGDGSWHCRCPAWKWNKEKPKTCKHIRDTAKPAYEAEQAA